MSGSRRKFARAEFARGKKSVLASLPLASELPTNTLIYPWLIANLQRLRIAEVPEDGVGLRFSPVSVADFLPPDIHPYLISASLARATRAAPDGRSGYVRAVAPHTSLPYETVWIESPGFCARPGPGVRVYGQLVTEAAEKTYSYGALASVNVDGRRYLGLFSDMYPAFMAPFLDFLLRPTAFSTFRDSCSPTANSTVGGLARAPAPLVYVLGKDHQPRQHLRRAGERISWVPSTEVMGHWRRVEHIGKNRHGEYVEIGRTWVIPHVRRYHEDAPDPEPRLRIIVRGSETSGLTH